jgi:hypothetical protein
VEDTKPDEFRALLELNVMAAFTATQAVLPWMRRQGRGHIVNVSSIVGRRGVPYRGAYSATKFALGGLSESLRVELAGTPPSPVDRPGRSPPPRARRWAARPHHLPSTWRDAFSAASGGFA